MNPATPAKISSCTDLKAWQEGHTLVLQVYRAVSFFPSSEAYCLSDQLRRAVVSITNNIAEGFGRYSCNEQTHFFYIALGSVKEVQNLLIICRDLKLIQSDTYAGLSTQSILVSRLLNGLIKSSKNRKVA